MNIDSSGVDIDVSTPDPVKKLFPTPDPSGLFQKSGKQAKLGRAEFQYDATPVDTMSCRIQSYILKLQYFSL